MIRLCACVVVLCSLWLNRRVCFVCDSLCDVVCVVFFFSPVLLCLCVVVVALLCVPCV